MIAFFIIYSDKVMATGIWCTLDCLSKLSISSSFLDKWQSLNIRIKVAL